MRTTLNINCGWKFVKGELSPEEAEKTGTYTDLPFTWNGEDGQDGGNDYFRGTCTFFKRFIIPEHLKARLKSGCVFIEFKGVNSSCIVLLNGREIVRHDGGYSTFRAEITDAIEEQNELTAYADNSPNEMVYPQTADFTFYGGIYRDVNLIFTEKEHFDLGFYGSCGVMVTPLLSDGKWSVRADARICGGGDVVVNIYDCQGNKVVCGEGGQPLPIPSPHLWNGVADPYLYTAEVLLICGGEERDRAEIKFGLRTFKTDEKNGFMLNGRPYPLRGVSRHQDRPHIGNALTRGMHSEDIELITEMGANAVRLAHYQQDDCIYDMCDEAGLIVWTEIPYISRHMPGADKNAEQQLKELIFQQYNHASIAIWGIGNEITMFRSHKAQKIRLLESLNDIAHTLDPARLTASASYAMCGIANKTAHIADISGWNLYLGWYVPGMFLNNIWVWLFRLLFPRRCLMFSEYGAEGVPCLHSSHPRRGDNSEEYQVKYHEYMVEFFRKNSTVSGAFVWNMFDFAADARNQGGDPGKNHKGLVTFDRKTKKDSFYLYKAYWSDKPFIHIAGKRFEKRTGRETEIKVYTNAGSAELFCNGKKISGRTKNGKVFIFKIELADVNNIVATSRQLRDECVIFRTATPEVSYKLTSKSTKNWQKN